MTLRTVSGDVELDDVDITIETPSVSISGLASSLEEDQQDEFTVSASGISSAVTYGIEMLAGDSDLSFADCAKPETTASSGSLSGSASYTRTFTLHACSVGGATVFASLLHGNRTIGLDSQYVTVTAAPPPPPPPGPAPAPGPAPTPPPSAFNGPSKFRYESSSTTAGQATFRWKAATSAAKHIIERYLDNPIPLLPGSWQKVGNDLGGSTSEVTLSDISVDSVQSYRVTAFKGDEMKHSNVVEVRLKLIPQNLAADSAGHGRAKLTWDPIDSAQSYVIQRRSRLYPTEDYSDWPTEKIESGPALDATTNKIEAVVKDLPPGEDSRFRVMARSVHGLSEGSIPSNTLRVTDDRPKGKPGNLKKFYRTGYRSMGISWDDDASGHSGYLVEMDPAPPASVNLANIQTYADGRIGLELDGLPYNNVYTFKVYAVNQTTVELVKANEPSVLSNVKVPEPHHWWGHQADHTVKYAKGTISNSFIEGAIKSGAEAWNTRMGHNLLICDDEGMGISCNSRMMDSGILTIKTVATTRDTPSAGCGENSMACVDRDGEGDPPSSPALAPGRHMLDMDIVFEAPGFSCPEDDDTCTNAEQLRILWTNDKNKHQKGGGQVDKPSVYIYVNYIMIHEFGHTLGMPDFYNDDQHGLNTVTDAVMNVPSVGRVTDEDLKQLHAIYRHHTRH